MSVVKQHKTSFERQIFESVLIYRGGNNILNSKSEFSRCQVPRLSLMVGEDQKYDNNQKNNEVLKIKRKIENYAISKPKRRKHDVVKNSSDIAGPGHDNSNSKDFKVLSDTQVIGEDEVSPNYAKKVIANPLHILNPPTSQPKVPPKKTRKIDKNIKGQKKISFYFFDTQRALKPNISCSISPAQPPT